MQINHAPSTNKKRVNIILACPMGLIEGEFLMFPSLDSDFWWHMQLHYGEWLENMDSSHLATRKNGNDKSTIPAPSQPMIIATLGMPTTLLMVSVTIKQPSLVTAPLTVEGNVLNMKKVVTKANQRL